MKILLVDLVSLNTLFLNNDNRFIVLKDREVLEITNAADLDKIIVTLMVFSLKNISSSILSPSTSFSIS